MSRILLDTGVIVALFNGKDKHHEKSVAFIKTNRHPLMTTVANVTEAMYLYKSSVTTQANVLKWLPLAKVQLADLTVDDMGTIADLLMQYNNVPMDFADGCLLHLANRWGIDKIATIDNDFYVYRIGGKYPFRHVF